MLVRSVALQQRRSWRGDVDDHASFLDGEDCLCNVDEFKELRSFRANRPSTTNIMMVLLFNLGNFVVAVVMIFERNTLVEARLDP